jgi:manganese transport protein
LVSVGYMDPGNWGTDIQGGSDFGYRLLWVLLLSNLMAILLQTLSAKLGIVTGQTLAENCREWFSRPVSLFLWGIAEVAMMATDLAEFLGAALGFYLLFGIPMFASGLLTGVVVFLILGLYRYGYRAVEYVIIGFVVIIGWCYVIELVLARPDFVAIAYHTVVPSLDERSLYVAIGMLGATVMPHNLFLHSGLVQTRLALEHRPSRRKLFRFAVVDAIVALNGAWLVNSAILIMSAAVFFQNGIPVASIGQAHATLIPLLGGLSSTVFAIALLSSGLSSSTTGTIAGQMVIEGFLRVRFPIWLRRLITMLPAMVVIGLGLDELKVLVLSQVILSFALPFAVIPLILFTARREMMGEHLNGPLTNTLAVATAAVIVFLNVLLLYQVLGGEF